MHINICYMYHERENERVELAEDCIGEHECGRTRGSHQEAEERRGNPVECGARGKVGHHEQAGDERVHAQKNGHVESGVEAEGDKCGREANHHVHEPEERLKLKIVGHGELRRSESHKREQELGDEHRRALYEEEQRDEQHHLHEHVGDARRSRQQCLVFVAKEQRDQQTRLLALCGRLWLVVARLQQWQFVAGIVLIAWRFDRGRVCRVTCLDAMCEHEEKRDDNANQSGYGVRHVDCGLQ